MSEAIKPAEILLFDFFDEEFKQALPESVLNGIALHDTIYQTILENVDYGVRISEADSDFASGSLDTIEEFDAYLTIVCFARIGGSDKTERQAAVQKVFDINKAVAALLLKSPTLGGRVCESMVLRSSRSFDVYNGEPFAVSNQPFVINPSGEYNFQTKG